jgi:O-antigen ligase
MSFGKNIDFDKVVYSSVLLFSFIIPLSRGMISFFIFWFFILMLYKREYAATFQTLKSNQIFAYISAFLLYMALTLFWSEDIKEGLNQIRLYGYWVLVLPAMAVLVKKEWLQSMLTAFLLGMFVSEILAYGMFFDLWTIKGKDSSYPTPFMTHIHYSIFLAFTAILLLSRVFSQSLNFYEKIPYAFFFLISTTNLMFSTGRAGQLAFFVSLVVLIFLKLKVSIKTLFISILSVVMIFFIAYNSLDLFKKRADEGVRDIKHILDKNYNSSFGIRVAYWIVAGEVIKEKPLFGNGIGDFIVSTKDVLSKNDFGLTEATQEFMTEQHFHNQYLMVAVQGGLIGLVLMILLFYKFFRLKMQDAELKEVSILGFVVIGVSFVAEPIWMLQFPLTLFLFITSISIISAKKKSDVL